MQGRTVRRWRGALRPGRAAVVVRRLAVRNLQAAAGAVRDRARLDLAQTWTDRDRLDRPAETDQPRRTGSGGQGPRNRAMTAAALLIVFVAAKAVTIAGHHLTLSWWTPIAYLWEDAAVVLVFAAVAAAAPR